MAQVGGKCHHGHGGRRAELHAKPAKEPQGLPDSAEAVLNGTLSNRPLQSAIQRCTTQVLQGLQSHSQIRRRASGQVCVEAFIDSAADQDIEPMSTGYLTAFVGLVVPVGDSWTCEVES